MAAHGAQLQDGGTEQEGLDYIGALFENVPVQPSSDGEALEIFGAGKGDVLLSYENEAIAARAAGEDIDYMVPDETILIENPVAVVRECRRRTSSDGQDGDRVIRPGRGPPVAAGGVNPVGLYP